MTAREIEIRRAVTDADVLATFPVMVELRQHLVEADYVAAIRTLEQRHGYELISLAADGEVTAAAGCRFGASLAWGPHLYVDDLVTSARRRSRGHGHLLMAWLIEHARARGCRELHLDSGVQRHAAHRFYLRERMDIACFHFKLEIK